MRRIILCLLLCVLPIAGCVKKLELKRYHIVSGVGIDTDDQSNVSVTAQFVVPLSKEQGYSEPTTITSHGITTFDAIRDLIIKNHRKPLWNHTKVFLIRDKLAIAGVLPAIDFFARDHESRIKMLTFIAEDSPEKLFSFAKGKSSPVTAFMIERAAQEQQFVGKAPRVTFYEFLDMMSTPRRDAFLPIIHYSEDKEHFQIYGTAIFRNERMIGRLNSEQTKYFLRLNDKYDGGLDNFVYTTPNGKSHTEVSLEVKSSKTDRKVVLVDGIPRIKCVLKEKAFLADMKQPLRLSESDLIALREQYADHLKRHIEDTWNVIKSMDTNVLGFGELIYRSDPTYWKEHERDWAQIRRQVKLQLFVDVEISETGRIRNLHTTPFQWHPNES